MTIKSKAGRRAAVLALVATIAIATGSFLRTAIDREVIPPHVALRMMGAVSLSSSNREYYRLKSEEHAFREELNVLGAMAPGEAKDVEVKRLIKELERITGQFGGFAEAHPDHSEGLITYGDLLADSGDRLGAIRQWERAAELEPRDADVCTKVAAMSLRRADLDKCFIYFEKALERAPSDVARYRDLSTAMFVYRQDAMEHYSINEQEVFDRSLALLDQAVVLEPDNATVAYDLATSFYTIKPSRTEEAIRAWEHVHEIAKEEELKQESALHIARFKIRAGELDEAQQMLALVDIPGYQPQRMRVQRMIDEGTPDEEPAGVVVLPASFKTR